MNRTEPAGPTISILLPAFNAGQTLDLALRSLCGQTFSDFGILLLDDGSDDDTAEIARAFSDPRVRVIQDGLKLGLARRLNMGIELARGRYIARMDADDVSFPERLARQVAFLEAHPDVDLVRMPGGGVPHRWRGSGLLPFAGTHEAMCAAVRVFLCRIPAGWVVASGLRASATACRRSCEPKTRSCCCAGIAKAALHVSRTYCLAQASCNYSRARRCARRSLLGAQLRYFCAATADLVRAAGALALTGARVAVDLLAALLFAGRLYFMRMSEHAPLEVVATLPQQSGAVREACRQAIDFQRISCTQVCPRNFRNTAPYNRANTALCATADIPAQHQRCALHRASACFSAFRFFPRNRAVL